jgi:hypothetical protein
VDRLLGKHCPLTAITCAPITCAPARR